jgi:hypothetical protein
VEVLRDAVHTGPKLRDFGSGDEISFGTQEKISANSRQCVRRKSACANTGRANRQISWFRRSCLNPKFYWSNVSAQIQGVIRYLNVTSSGRQWVANLSSPDRDAAVESCGCLSRNDCLREGTRCGRHIARPARSRSSRQRDPICSAVVQSAWDVGLGERTRLRFCGRRRQGANGVDMGGRQRYRPWQLQRHTHTKRRDAVGHTVVAWIGRRIAHQKLSHCPRARGALSTSRYKAIG